MKRFLRFAVLAWLAACAFASAHAVTTVVATWTDFRKTTSGDYTLTIDNSCIIGQDGSVTIGSSGGVALTLPANDPIRTGMLVTIVADVEGILPTGDKRTVFAIKTANGNFANLTKNADNVIYSKADDAANYGNIGNVSTIGRSQLAYAYSYSTGTDAWIESDKKATDKSLRWWDTELTDIFIGSCGGTSQVMQGLKIHKLTIYADKLTTAAAICPNGPAYLYKFNGNYDSLGSSSLTFDGEKANNFSASPSGQALKIVNGSTHPHGGNWSYGNGNWCVSTFAKPIADASNKIVLWTTGVKGDWFGLLSDSANNKAILASGNAGGITTTICAVDVPNISDFFHLYTVRFVGNNTYELIVDGNVEEKVLASYATAVPTGSFQIGAVNGGLPTGLARTTGSLIDDFREYQRTVSDEEVQALAASFVTPETISINVGGGRETGELAANSDKLVQNSECAGLAPAPGVGWNNIPYEWNNGGTTKEIAAGSVKVTDGIKLVARDTVAVTVSAKNTYDGGAARVNSYHKGYLDDGDYNGHKSYIKVTGIPYLRYNVIIYAATDTNPSAYGSVKVNGSNYTWKDGATQLGTDAWGDSSVTATEYGKNALIVQSVNGSTLEVEGTTTGGRGGIAAIQVVDAGATQSRVISVNFGSDRTAVTAGTDPGGILADKNWWNVPNGSGTDVAIDTAKVTYTAAGTYSGDATQQHLKSYLDENKGGSPYPISITVKDLEDVAYDVYIYCGSDNASGWTYKTVNGVNYYGDADGEAVEGTESWGSNSGTTSVMGENVMVVRNVALNADGNIVIGSQRNGTKRGSISAIQLKKLPKAMNYVATVTQTADWSELAWSPARPSGGFPPSANFTLTNTATAATLTLDEDVNANRLTVVGAAGKMLTFKKYTGVTTMFASLDFSNAVEGVGFDAREADFTACQTLLDYARAHNEKFYFYGSGASGATLDYGTAYSNYTFSGHYVFDGGTHTFQNASEDRGLYFGANATADNPTLWAKDNTTLYFKSRNPCGWNTYTNTAGIVRIGNGAKVVAANSAAGTWYWSQQFYFEPGATLEIATAVDKFRLNGGCGEDAPQIFMPASDCGTAEITSAAAANNLCIGDNNYSAAAVKVGAGSTLTISSAMKTLTDGKKFGKYGSGKLALTGDLSGFGAAITVSEGTLDIASTAYLKNAATLAVNAGAMLKINAGTSVFTNRCTMTNNGTIEVTGGTVVFAPGWNGTIVENGGRVVLGYTVGVNDIGKFAIPAGKTWENVAVFDADGNALAITGHDAGYVYFDWKITGRECWWDYEFNGNLTSVGTDTTTLDAEGTHPYYNTASNALWVGHATPYRGATYPAEFTAVMFGKVVNNATHLEIGFGSTTKGTKYGVAIACGDPSQDEVRLLITHGYDVTETISMKVPNAYTANHLYAFTCQTVDDGGTDKTKVSVYLDGKPLQSYMFVSKVTLGTGFQIGSMHGGKPTGYEKATTANENAYLDFLRTYKTVLTDEAMAKYAEEYPYVSPADTATRTFAGNGTWTAENAWTLTPFEGAAYQTNRPSAKALVTISATADSEVTFDLDEAANYETFDVAAGSPIALRTGGTVKPFVAGFTTIGANLTVDYDAIAFSGPITVKSGKTLIYDFRTLDATNQLTSVTNVLTGMVTVEAGAKVEGVNIAQPTGRVVEFVQNAATGQYELRITVMPFVYTIEGEGPGTWTWGGTDVTEAEVDAYPVVPIWKEGNGTLLKALTNRTYVVNGGTFKANGAGGKTATVTVNAGATFDFNGSADGYITVILNSGFLVNNGGGIWTGSRQMAGLTLTGDSIVGGSGNFGLISNQYGANTLALNGNVLTKKDANTFFLCNTTISGAGAIVVQSGIVEVFKASSFAGGAITNAGTVKIDNGATFTVGKIVGGTIENAGTLGNVTLAGSVTLKGAGTYMTNTLDGAVVDVKEKRGLVFDGTGTVDVTLTAAELSTTNAVAVFESVAGSHVAFGTIRDSAGNDITDKCSLRDGAITVLYEAKIGETLYVTLLNALAAAEASQTVVMLRDVLLTNGISRACTLDVAGRTLSVSNVAITAKGNLLMADSSSGSGRVEILQTLIVSGGSSCRLTMSAAMTTVGGSLVVADGTLAVGNGSVSLDGVSVQIGSGGKLDLSSGKSISCLNFKSTGDRVVGTDATLVVVGTLDALEATKITRLELPYGATLKGAGLTVTTSLVLGDFLIVTDVTEEQAKERLVMVPNAASYSTAVMLNGKEGYVIRRVDTVLKVVKDDVITAHVVVDTVPGANFESLEIKGEVSDWGGKGLAHGKTNVYVVVQSESMGVAVTQRVEYVSRPSAGTGTFSAEFKDISAGGSYTVSAYVHIDGGEMDAQSMADAVVAARSVGGWINENAQTFVGAAPGTGTWLGTNDVACVTNASSVIAFTSYDWQRVVEFHPTNDTPAARCSLVKDLHYKMTFECPGLYTCEDFPAVPDGWISAITLIADDDDKCGFAVVSNGVWTAVESPVVPVPGEPYEILIRVECNARTNVTYYVVDEKGTTKLASGEYEQAPESWMLPMSGVGTIAEIYGVCQDENLLQVGDQEFTDFGDACAAAGDVMNIIPLWWSRLAVNGTGGKFRIVHNGLLELLWKKWHHYSSDRDGNVDVYRYLSGNNWIEYADASGVVQDANGAFLVTNEVGLAWIAESATNAWFCGDVTLGAPLDLSSKNWTPVARFSGVFDGQGQVISGLNNTNVNCDPLLVRDGSGYYFGGPTNGWGRMSYGLFAATTNAEFRNVVFEDVAISNVSETVAPLLGALEGGDLVVSNVMVASGLVLGEGGAVAGMVGTVEGWGVLSVVNNANGAVVASANLDGASTNWVAGILTVGGTNETVGTLVVTGNVFCGTVANVVRNDGNGGNVAQILAGTTWGTKFGEVVVSNNVAAGEVVAEITDHDGWRLGPYDEWLSKVFPVCNLAPAVTYFTEEDGYRRFVEASSPGAVPVDPVFRTARMLAGRFQNGWRNFAGEWMDTITTMTNGCNLWITGEMLTNDTWQTVTVDRSIGFDLRGNTICTVYDPSTFRITHGSQLSISNGTILLPQGAQAFECVGTSSVISNDINVVTMPWDFYGQMVAVDGEPATLDMLVSMLNFLPSGTSITMAENVSIDPDTNAMTYDGTKIATLAGYRSVSPAESSGKTVTYVLELNGDAVPDFDLVAKSTSSPDGSVTISLSGTRAGFYYAVQKKVSLVEKGWSDASEWQYVATEGAPVSFELPAAESSGFYRIKVTDVAPVAE